ncbi:MAG: pseudouridine synthase [Chloroflexota bacterium]|nr:MAG: pseudouridine synthase [Chloroflexota bacterium]
MKERLQKVLARHGVASRRKAEGIISLGRVTVNGEIAVVGQAVDLDHDRIAVDGSELRARPASIYVALHKPTGYVTSLRSTHGERLVKELVNVPERLVPVGRLDRETSGLLLLTNDGEWLNRIAHPRYEVEKEYWALVRGRVNAGEIERLREGMLLSDGAKTAPATVHVVERHGGDTAVNITVVEGRKRQIRLMLEAIRHPAFELRRTRIGPLSLSGLGPGEWRFLTEKEVLDLDDRRDPHSIAVPASRSH